MDLNLKQLVFQYVRESRIEMIKAHKYLLEDRVLDAYASYNQAEHFLFLAKATIIDPDNDNAFSLRTDTSSDQ